MDQPRRSAPDAPARWTRPLQFTPASAEVDALIERAGSHPLGVDFLRSGELASVAATFRTHAFTVVAARDRLLEAERR